MEKARFVAALSNTVARASVYRGVFSVAAVALAYGLAAYIAISLTRNATSVAAIWPANGILLAALLSCRRPATRWMLVASCAAANAVAIALNGDPWATIAAFPAISVFETLLAFQLLRYACGDHVELTSVWTVAKFVAVCLAAPLAPALIGAWAASQVFNVGMQEAFTTWYLSDSLGLLILTPTILLLRSKAQPSEIFAPSFEDVFRHFLLLTGVSLVVFLQSSVPLLFLLVPISVLIAFRLGPRYTGVATLWLTAVSLACTYQGWGPAALMDDPATGIWVVQLFCFVTLLTSLAVAAELADRERLRGELERVSALANDRRRQLDTALDAMHQGVCLFDRDRRIVVRNSRFLAIYGLSEDNVPPGTSLAELMETCASVGALPEHQEEGVELNVDNDIEQQLVDGRHIRISQRTLVDGGVICTYTDFTAEKRAEFELLHRTLHDPLTGLPNRSLLVDRIEQALAAARRGGNAAVMLLDIDYFKSVNDNLGHAAGDELLRVVADRLRGCVRDTDTIARLGGDEFALLLVDGDQPCSTAVVARRIISAVKQPILVEGKPIRIGMSIGIAKPPVDGTTTDEILKAADVALYKAKRTGRGKFAFFDASEDAGACSARRLESELVRAVENQEFRVVYQPIVAGSSSTVAALEALIRWDHPELGTISPAEFVPLAERNGLIVEIGDWVLDRACRDATRLPAGIKVSVNLSRVQLSDRDFVRRVSETLERTGLPPERLELEITETAIIDNEEDAARVLKELCGLGVSVAIDDFGVGQSALSCLRVLPIDRIKIDRSFINDLATDPKARSIFIAVASLAKSLGIETTAEGIETEQQRIIAALAGCNHLQGYFLGRPDALENLKFEEERQSDDTPQLDKAG